MYTTEPEDKEAFTAKMDRQYSRTARIYDTVIRLLPTWRSWIGSVLPHINGPRVLEVSFGTGYLLSQYADQHETYGIDFNWDLTQTAIDKLNKGGIKAHLTQADVEKLPFQSSYFDTLVNTMSFTGYPDGRAAMSEMRRVLKVGGQLLIVDVNYPSDRGGKGMKLARFWSNRGDILRDMGALFNEFGFEYTDEEVGGFGSVHLYIATKDSPANFH
jgi:ubiquinone/menaquinone biosynthesis C-methylase UbiE